MPHKSSPKDHYSINTGIILRALREHRKWSQEIVAQALGEVLGREVYQSTIQRIEMGQSSITVQRLVMLANVFKACPKKILSAVAASSTCGKRINLALHELVDLYEPA